MFPFEIRPAVEDDLPQVEEIEAECFPGDEWPVRDYLEYEFFVAARGPVVLGCIAWQEIDSTEAELLSIATRITARRQGIAKALLRRMLDACRGTVWLEVRESNKAGRKLYESYGFQQVGERPEYYTNNSETAVVMKLCS